MYQTWDFGTGNNHACVLVAHVPWGQIATALDSSVLWVVSMYLFIFGIGRGLGEEFCADCDNGDLGWRGRAG